MVDSSGSSLHIRNCVVLVGFPICGLIAAFFIEARCQTILFACFHHWVAMTGITAGEEFVERKIHSSPGH